VQNLDLAGLARAEGEAEIGGSQGVELCGLTFELTPRAEAGGVSPGRDDSTTGADWAYTACRSESGVERVVRPHAARALICSRTASAIASSLANVAKPITDRAPMISAKKSTSSTSLGS